MSYLDKRRGSIYIQSQLDSEVKAVKGSVGLIRLRSLIAARVWKLFVGSLSVEIRRKNREEQEGLDQMGMRPKKHKESRRTAGLVGRDETRTQWRYSYMGQPRTPARRRAKKSLENCRWVGTTRPAAQESTAAADSCVQQNGHMGHAK
ncbi:hypothetical protein B0H14DRAFT_3124276 [Mycena olivaceomarginata]|nr:hypothetical protein B0H14DRAFT_3124276 [Mycena olivaceomarginata]